jgi:hypothetical protein
MMDYRPGTFKMGRCFIIITIDNGAWHLSISTKDKLPSYKEIKAARYTFLPNELYFAEIFPPKEEFVNLHPFVRHLWQINIEESNYL